jgi:hypothetical protein
MKTMKHLALALLIGAGAAFSAVAQVTPTPLAPPVASPPPQAAPSTLSPVLTNPRIVQTPYGRTTAPTTGTSGMSPLDQQKLQSYRGDLTSQQRALENQGASVNSEAYRNVQQQLNQLNNSGR